MHGNPITVVHAVHAYLTNQSMRFTPITLKRFWVLRAPQPQFFPLGKVTFINLAFQVITKLKIFVLIFARAFNKDEQPIATDKRSVKLNQLVMVTYTDGADTIDIKHVRYKRQDHARCVQSLLPRRLHLFVQIGSRKRECGDPRTTQSVNSSANSLRIQLLRADVETIFHDMSSHIVVRLKSLKRITFYILLCLITEVKEKISRRIHYYHFCKTLRNK